MLNEDEKQILLRITRESIQNHLKGRIYTPGNLPGTLAEERGAFVTLKKGGQLRGCIGYIRAIEPLGIAVSKLVVDAAVHDPRFRPLEPEELDQVRIEISVLTPMERISDPVTVEVGKHGLYIKRGAYSGLLLPQVPVEWGWGREKFLDQTCLKAGLSTSAWKDSNTEIYVFTADVFGENEGE